MSDSLPGKSNTELTENAHTSCRSSLVPLDQIERLEPIWYQDKQFEQGSVGIP
jgi:hypothetical protein